MTGRKAKSAEQAPPEFPPEPPQDCSRCSRLSSFLAEQRNAEPSWWNAPVPSFGPVGGPAGNKTGKQAGERSIAASNVKLLIVGLAPGLKGANRTGRPFTGDYAGDLLYATLHEFGFSLGTYDARADDGLQLTTCMITNAVRCVPPQNKPTSAEINNCRPFLASRIASLPELQAILVLGRIAHDSTLRTLGAKLKDHPFAHGAKHGIASENLGDVTLFDSYHCSRYNTNTRRLTTPMFRSVFKSIAAHIGPATAS